MNVERPANSLHNDCRRTFLSRYARARGVTTAPFIPRFLLPNHALCSLLNV